MNEASPVESAVVEPAPETPSSRLPPPLKKFFSTTRGKAIAVVVILVVLLGVAGQQVYARPVDDPFVRTMVSIFPFPALSVNGTTVTMKEYLTEYDALKKYFDGQGADAPPADELETAIADTLTNKVAIRQLAQARGIEIDQARVEKYYQDVIASQESEEAFVQDLDDTFGWSVEEFKSRVVESIVLALQMSEVILADNALQQPRRDTIDAADARVLAGEDFAAVAKEVNAGFEAGLEADLGYVKLSIIPPSWASAVDALSIGSMTEVLDLPEGYAVFKAEDRTESDEDTQIHLLSITVPKMTLEEVVKGYLASVEVKRYVGEI
ncbi:SurA N-terminal domain-containing protein [Candidatus Uhrbacteria bacterium]|nr:SurA N-terminal domain-containing protein [Candidatus Uhrbacteria bacterium]